MLTHVELDPTFALREQYADTSQKATILVEIFDVDPGDQDAFKEAWLLNATFRKAQSGCVSAQLHQGILGSRLFLDYAVFEDAAALAAMDDRPESRPLRRVYPDSATAHPHLFRRVHVKGICTGEIG